MTKKIMLIIRRMITMVMIKEKKKENIEGNNDNVSFLLPLPFP